MDAQKPPYCIHIPYRTFDVREPVGTVEAFPLPMLGVAQCLQSLLIAPHRLGGVDEGLRIALFPVLSIGPAQPVKTLTARQMQGSVEPQLVDRSLPIF